MRVCPSDFAMADDKHGILTCKVAHALQGADGWVAAVKGKDQIVKEFLNKHPAVSKSQVIVKLNEVALKEKRIDVEGVLSGIESYHLYLIRSLPQALELRNAGT